MLLINKASSRQVREMTSNEFSVFTIKDRPMDRGGRTTEMVAPLPDSPYWQKKRQSNNDGSQHGHQGGFFDQYRNQRDNHIENQVFNF